MSIGEGWQTPSDVKSSCKPLRSDELKHTQGYKPNNSTNSKNLGDKLRCSSVMPDTRRDSYNTCTEEEIRHLLQFNDDNLMHLK